MLPLIPKGMSNEEEEVVLLTETLSFACLNTLGAWVDSPPAAVEKRRHKQTTPNLVAKIHLNAFFSTLWMFDCVNRLMQSKMNFAYFETQIQFLKKTEL